MMDNKGGNSVNSRSVVTQNVEEREQMGCSYSSSMLLSDTPQRTNPDIPKNSFKDNKDLLMSCSLSVLVKLCIIWQKSHQIKTGGGELWHSFMLIQVLDKDFKV